MPRPFAPVRRSPSAAATIGLALAASACAVLQEPIGPVRSETVHAVTRSNQLITFNAGRPQQVLSRLPILGLADDETLRSIDYRVARGQLFGLTSRNRLVRLDPVTGQAVQVGDGVDLGAADAPVGIDFNPTVDRIRVVAGARNLRLHPDTGAQIDGDPATPGVQPDGRLRYLANDPAEGRVPVLLDAAYTYNKRDEKITTNYAIDGALGTLVLQGSLEGAKPFVSPNSGVLRTVGPLGIDPPFARAAFDIADVSNAAFAAVSRDDRAEPGWYEIDLQTGRARLIGTIRANEPVHGIAIAP